ncbi:MAG: hypothetical protein ACK4XY_09630 [Chloroherpetonaceae bacterium]
MFFTNMTNTQQLFRDIQHWFSKGNSVYEVQGKVNQKYRLIIPLSLLERLSEVQETV